MHTNYYPLSPISNTDGLGESLTGFLCRVATLHGISTNTLLTHLDQIAHTRIPQTYTLLDARTFNGHRDVSKRIQAAMRRLYPDLDLRPHTLNDVGKVFCPKGRGLLNWDRHWCPECFAEQRANNDVVFERLCWQVANAKICPIHGCQLQSTCPSCGKLQHRMPPSGHLDVCTKCQAWLGSQPKQEQPLSEPEYAYESWAAKQIALTISRQHSFGNLITGNEIAATLHKLCEQHDCSASTIAKMTKKPAENIRIWMSRGRNPTMTNWLRVCASLNLELANTIFSPKDASIQLNLDFSPPALPPLKKKARSNSYSAEKIRAAINHQLSLKRPSVSSIVDLAKQIEVSVSAIFYHCKLETKKLSGKIAAIRRTESNLYQHHLKRVGTKLIVRRWLDGLTTTRKQFVAALVEKEACSKHKAKDTFPVSSKRATRLIDRISD